MKRIFFRFLLTLYILAVIFIAVIVICCAVSLISKNVPTAWLDMLYSDVNIQVGTCAIGAAMLILSFGLMFARTSDKKSKTKILKRTDDGSVEVSMMAVEGMVKKFFLDIANIRSSSVRILSKDEGVIINSKITVMPGTNIPDLTTDIQKRLKDNIETFSGIPVKKTKIVVVDNATGR